ncbi:hypothetical protein B0H34DRAFT_811708 [Crassisporium funariophilum]|nr:hypothetical protein B0H34DRAFT_811708 [Crassisporium funariophilum]
MLFQSLNLASIFAMLAIAGSLTAVSATPGTTYNELESRQEVTDAIMARSTKVALLTRDILEERFAQCTQHSHCVTSSYKCIQESKEFIQETYVAWRNVNSIQVFAGFPTRRVPDLCFGKR